MHYRGAVSIKKARTGEPARDLLSLLKRRPKTAKRLQYVYW